MIVMIANNRGAEAKKLRDSYPDRIGHIYSPGGMRRPWPIYAIDNGAFVEWSKGRSFDATSFLALLDQAKKSGVAPRWVAVPDAVADRESTLIRWHDWEPTLRGFGWPLAFVVQNGMSIADVPSSADWLFVGGDTEWKRETAAYWCAHFPRVHVGRVNTERDLWRYHRAGAESCDGTGWFRGRRAQLDGLWYYLADTEGLDDPAHGPLQGRLFGRPSIATATGL
jgi:hypothetical protein